MTIIPKQYRLSTYPDCSVMFRFKSLSQHIKRKLAHEAGSYLTVYQNKNLDVVPHTKSIPCVERTTTTRTLRKNDGEFYLQDLSKVRFVYNGIALIFFMLFEPFLIHTTIICSPLFLTSKFYYSSRLNSR